VLPADPATVLAGLVTDGVEDGPGVATVNQSSSCGYVTVG
jgi:hypothetical protein